MTYWNIVQARTAIIYFVYRGIWKHGAQHVLLRYLVGDWRLVGLKDRAQPLDIKYQKCTDLLLNYHRSERYACCMPNGCSKNHTRCRASMQIPNTSRGVALSSKSSLTYTAIRILRVEPGIFGKEEDIVPLAVSIFVIQRTVFNFLYVALSRKIAVVVLSVRTAANDVAPYERILKAQQTCSFPD